MKKISVMIPVTNEQLGIGKPATPEELAQWRAAEQARNDLIAGAGAYNAAVTNPIAREILIMHRPHIDRSYPASCDGCQFSGYDSEPPDWPCQTTTKIREMLEAR